MTVEEESRKRFSFIESVTPILLREKKNEGNDKSKRRSSLENPVFRQPLEKWQPFESHVDRDTNKEVNNLLNLYLLFPGKQLIPRYTSFIFYY